ncbi:hypothetical protein D9619_006346 [Psilocybe cf. subviscida]|uniref:Uncharacterized protein n=1 Tax=Psilocybe cf. subviscida TaxID=2480587 RepID=A0A8H5B495_9AGAR|nr:hypothetical protein D9619_006346 [Psilocybe cf. subviscida]
MEPPNSIHFTSLPSTMTDAIKNMFLRANHRAVSLPSSLSIDHPLTQHEIHSTCPKPGVVHFQKMNQLRDKAEAALTRAEDSEAKVKTLEQQLLERDQVIKSLEHRLGLLEADNEAAESKLAEFKTSSLDGEHSRQTADGLVRKVQLLEEELDAAEKNLKETVEKLRQVDIKAEHFERQVSRAEQERDQWEKKYEELQEKYAQSKRELDELEKSMADL